MNYDPTHLTSPATLQVPGQDAYTANTPDAVQPEPVPRILVVSAVEGYDYERDVADDNTTTYAMIWVNSGKVHTIYFANATSRNMWLRVLEQRISARR